MIPSLHTVCKDLFDTSSQPVCLKMLKTKKATNREAGTQMQINLSEKEVVRVHFSL